MSTAPSADNLEAILQQLLALSEALLTCEESNIDGFQQLLDQREPLLTRLQSMSLDNLTPDERQAALQLAHRVQLLDQQVEERFQVILASYGMDLRHIHQGRQVLAQYKFPYTASSNRVENQG